MYLFEAFIPVQNNIFVHETTFNPQTNAPQKSVNKNTESVGYVYVLNSFWPVMVLTPMV